MGAFVVLLTDGANNRGALQPRAGRRARQVARHSRLHHRRRQGRLRADAGVRRRTAARSATAACSPTSTKAGCAQIADATGGKFFRAADTDTIERPSPRSTARRRSSSRPRATSSTHGAVLVARRPRPRLLLASLAAILRCARHHRAGAAGRSRRDWCDPLRPFLANDLPVSPHPSFSGSSLAARHLLALGTGAIAGHRRLLARRFSSAEAWAALAAALLVNARRRGRRPARASGSGWASRCPSSPSPARSGAGSRSRSSTSRARSSSRSTCRAVDAPPTT